jgi:hypothetical protein
MYIPKRWHTLADEYVAKGKNEPEWGSREDFLTSNYENIISDIAREKLGELGETAVDHSLLRQLGVEALDSHMDLREGPDNLLYGGMSQNFSGPQTDWNTGLSLGLSAINEVNGSKLNTSRVNPTLESARDIILNDLSHGTKSNLATVGLESSEKSGIRKNLPAVDERAADRVYELITGINPTAGYSYDQLRVAGGHGIARKTAKEIGIPELITARHNMEFEGDLDNEVRHEHRGKTAAGRSLERLARLLGESDMTHSTAERLINSLIFATDPAAQRGAFAGQRLSASGGSTQNIVQNVMGNVGSVG